MDFAILRAYPAIWHLMAGRVLPGADSSELGVDLEYLGEERCDCGGSRCRVGQRVCRPAFEGGFQWRAAAERRPAAASRKIGAPSVCGVAGSSNLHTY